MAQQDVTDNGVLIVPGAYGQVQVQNNPTNLGTSGVILLVGESDSGPRFSDESDLSLNAFGPDQIVDFTKKYGSGPLVDAFRGAASAANDPNISGSFSSIIAVKTNTPTRAKATLLAPGASPYAYLLDASNGRTGNFISYTTTISTAESLPTTGPLIICPPQVTANPLFGVNGGVPVSATLTVGMLPSAMKTAIDALAGVACTGGVNRSILTSAAGTLAITVDSGNQVHFTVAGNTFVNVPTVGDILYLPSTSPLTANNEGTYVVTAATSTRIDAYKLLDAAGAGTVLSAPTTQAGQTIAATTDIQAFSPLVITLEAGAAIQGVGKSLEISNGNTSPVTSVSGLCFVFSGASSTPPASTSPMISVAGAGKIITSTAEQAVDINVARQSDSLSQDVITGGDIYLTLGFNGGSMVPTATATVSNGFLTTSISSGGTNLSIRLSDYATINDLVAYINTQSLYFAAPGSVSLGQASPLDLDQVTAVGIGATFVNTVSGPGRIKADGVNFQRDVNAGSTLVTVGAISPAIQPSGLPDVNSMAFLAGGAKGPTLAADVSAAFTALEGVRGNFVVPLFSRDATLDIAAGTTDSSSTYTIDAVHALARSHVLKMSQLKRRRPRQAFLSYRGTFKDAQTKAGNMASSRCAMFFQDIKQVNSVGTIVQFQPWMAAVKAAGMQAAGFYRAIVSKFIDISGALQAAGDYNDQLDSSAEAALTYGLCPIVRDITGGYRWVSDQTTYTKDNNFVYNSIQAMYDADQVNTTCQTRMEGMFVGQSVADISASIALTAFEGILSDLKRLKLLAASDDAPKGYRKPVINIIGPAMACSVEIKLAGAIYFITINFLATPVVSSAG